MKMVKKVLMGVAAVAALAVFAGCGLKDEDGMNWSKYTKDKQNKIAFYAQIYNGAAMTGSWEIPDTVFFAGDDTEGAIKGADNKYTVEYDNTKGATPYRAYKETALKHAGALVKVTFDDRDVSSSKMGVIFDLKDSEVEGGKDFYIIGVNPVVGKNNFYVSKFTNIVNINDENFGASTKATGTDPKEIEIVALTQDAKISGVEAAEDGSVSYYVYFKLAADGSFDYAVLDLTDDEMKDFKGSKKFLAANIDDYKVLVKGNTLAKAGAEYEAAETSEAAE